MGAINKGVKKDSRFNQNQNINNGKLEDLKQFTMDFQGSSI